DASTNLLSHFQVIETLQISKIPPEALQSGQPVLVPMVSLLTTAVWMKMPDDSPQQEYEFETAFFLPPDGAEQVVHHGKFFFSEGKPFYRLTVRGYLPPFTGPGLFRIESRIRKVGEEQWLRQDY